MRLHNIYIYYADISHNERKWRCCYIVCADKMPHAMRWPMSFYTTTQLLFLFFNFHSNFHPVSLFPAVNWERYIFLSAVCISRPGRCVLESSVCVLRCLSARRLAGVHPTEGRAQPMAVERHQPSRRPPPIQHRPSGSRRTQTPFQLSSRSGHPI
jgi:hypothetical protein